MDHLPSGEKDVRPFRPHSRNCQSLQVRNLHWNISTPTPEMTKESRSSVGTSRAKNPRLKPTAILQAEVDYLKKEREEMKKLNMKEREERQQVASQLDAVVMQLER
jgi:hypothetical protein